MSTQTVVSLTSATTSAAIPVNPHATGNIPPGFVMDFDTGTGVGTASVEFTQNDLPTIAAGNAIWFKFPNLSAKTATAMDSPIMPVRAVRLNVTAYTSGTISLRVLQGSNYNS